MKTDDIKTLPLFAWTPPVKVIAFPLNRRAGKIRDVARKLVTKTTERHADHYREQVSSALRGQLEKVGTCLFEQERQITLFWSEVDREVTRIHFRDSHGGAA
jgi:Iap family predicted aminopeptidase